MCAWLGLAWLRRCEGVLGLAWAWLCTYLQKLRAELPLVLQCRGQLLLARAIHLILKRTELLALLQHLQTLV